MEAFCKCGARRYASEAEAHKVERSGADKCPVCHTFALDHGYRGDENLRCFDCETRPYSHGGPQYAY